MFDFSQMFGSPQAKEMMFSMMAQQMSQAPPELREALSHVPVTIVKRERGFELRIGKSENERVEGMIRSALNSWSDLLTRGFQTIGYDVHVYE